jgi:hypothetical protein
MKKDHFALVIVPLRGADSFYLAPRGSAIVSDYYPSRSTPYRYLCTFVPCAHCGKDFTGYIDCVHQASRQWTAIKQGLEPARNRLQLYADEVAVAGIVKPDGDVKLYYRQGATRHSDLNYWLRELPEYPEDCESIKRLMQNIVPEGLGF